MYGIDETVWVKGTIIGVAKGRKDSGMEYTVQIEDTIWNSREVTVKESNVTKVFSMDELEKLCDK